jgi:diaminopimelate epimerase
MRIPFVKYSATGNDFVVVDNRLGEFDVGNTALWEKICHRAIGVGADGALFVESSETADFKMRYVNADGGEVSMCGNGGRAITHYVHHVLKIGEGKKDYTFETTQAKYCSSMDDEFGVKLQMTELSNWEKVDLTQFQSEGNSIYLETGVPHCIFEHSDLESLDIVETARPIRYHEDFSEGTNINFYQVLGEGRIKLRTFERGVEGETLSCGTGATAAALAMSRFYGWKEKVSIETKGGLLTIQYNEDLSKVFLCGEARETFRGTVAL